MKVLKHSVLQFVAVLSLVIIIGVIINRKSNQGEEVKLDQDSTSIDIDYNKPTKITDANTTNNSIDDQSGTSSSTTSSNKPNNSDSDNTAMNNDNETIEENVNVNQLCSKYLKLKKSSDTILNIEVQDLYMERKLIVTIPGLENQTFDEASLVRMNQGNEYKGMPTVTTDNQITASSSIEIDETTNQAFNDPVAEYSIEHVQDLNNTNYTAIFNITLDNVYVPIVHQDSENIYIELKHPKEVYDKIIVIDAGHGGKDPGTHSIDEKYYEKDVNLAILLYLKEILDKSDIKVYYTRNTDQTVYLNPRVYLANDVEADLFLSIHCNANEHPNAYGSEVLYNELDQDGGLLSKDLAEISLEEILKVTERVNRGVVKGSEMVIIGKSKVPVVIVEVAFMTNQKDLELLLQEDKKQELAEALYRVISRAYDEFEP